MQNFLPVARKADMTLRNKKPLKQIKAGFRGEKTFVWAILYFSIEESMLT
jgi:hypothetical protein